MNESLDSFTQLGYPDSFNESDKNGNPTEKPSTSATSLSRSFEGSTSKAHQNESELNDWQISINQFLATTMMVSVITESFSKTISLTQAIERLQKKRRKCILPTYY